MSETRALVNELLRTMAETIGRLQELTGQDIHLMADVFNVLNARPTTSVEERHVNDGAGFGVAEERP